MARGNFGFPIVVVGACLRAMLRLSAAGRQRTGRYVLICIEGKLEKLSESIVALTKVIEIMQKVWNGKG